MRRYELCLILKPEIGDEGFHAKIEEIKQYLEKENAVYVRELLWNLRQLAYPIKNNKKGYYAFLIYDMLPEKISEIKRNFQIDEDFLRSIIRYEKEKKVLDEADKGPDIDESDKGYLDEGDGDAKEVNSTDYGESE